MKIEVLDFFKKEFKSCYLITNKEPRRFVLLVRFNNTKKVYPYGRYLMMNHLNRLLFKNEQVDHIDGDKLNDIINNLQILSPKDNNIKKINQLNKNEKSITLTCPQCNILFTKKSGKLKFKLDKGKKPCCSRVCGGKYSHRFINN